MKEEAQQQFMIQIERPDEKLNMEGVRQLLAPTGMELDPSYGPILVNPKLGRYVVRGKGTTGARAEAEKINGVQLFSDAKIQPAKLTKTR
jgi:hypothetical protein